MAYIMKNTRETIIVITEKEDFQSNLYTNVCMVILNLRIILENVFDRKRFTSLQSSSATG